MFLPSGHTTRHVSIPPTHASNVIRVPIKPSTCVKLDCPAVQLHHRVWPALTNTGAYVKKTDTRVGHATIKPKSACSMRHLTSYPINLSRAASISLELSKKVYA